MTTPEIAVPPPRRSSFVAGSVYVFERIMPDPFVLAIGLTILVVAAALLFAPNGAPSIVVTSWYAGVFGILGFAFQMILILATGHALAHAPAVQRGLRALVAKVQSANQAVVMTFLVAAAASWLNWGFGLVIGAVLAREVAKRVRVDFGWLVASAYSGWVIWASGLSSSIALSQATHGNALNVVEKLTGIILPFSQTIFTAFNLLPTLVVVIVIPLVFIRLRPRDDEMQVFVPADEPEATRGARPRHLRRSSEPFARAQPVPGRARRRRSRRVVVGEGRVARRQCRDPDLPDRRHRPFTVIPSPMSTR